MPEDLFLNDVLPYAVFDEPRDPWRAEFLERARPLVKDARTASEAAQRLNRDLFNLINVHYNTGRKRPNQSARESIALGQAIMSFNVAALPVSMSGMVASFGVPPTTVATGIVMYSLAVAGLVFQAMVRRADRDGRFFHRRLRHAGADGEDEASPPGSARNNSPARRASLRTKSPPGARGPSPTSGTTWNPGSG